MTEIKIIFHPPQLSSRMDAENDSDVIRIDYSYINLPGNINEKDLERIHKSLTSLKDTITEVLHQVSQLTA